MTRARRAAFLGNSERFVINIHRKRTAWVIFRGAARRTVCMACCVAAVIAAISGCARARREPPLMHDGFRDLHTPGIWPVQHSNAVVSSPFGAPRGARRHQGIDITVPFGTPVHATANGRVAFSGVQRDYGHIVHLEHGGGLATLYAHLSERRVREGDLVQRGQVIGRVGQSGNATGPHLHYEVRRNGIAVDPRPYLPGAAP